MWKAYCTELKIIAEDLKNSGVAVSDTRMSLQLLQGLTEDFKSFRSTVQHMSPLSVLKP